jgi:hypothetical protein
VESHSANGDRAPIALLDPGWLFVLAGIGVVAAAILIPAAGDLAEVQVQRDRALAIEDHKLARRSSYEDYLAALKREEPALVLALAASQLNQIPKNRSVIPETTIPHRGGLGGGAAGLGGVTDASVFGALEPALARLPERQTVDSLLERWTGSDTIRPWLMGLGVFSLFIGLLPPATRPSPKKRPNPSPA